MSATSKLLVREVGKDAFDLVDPGGALGREVQVEARMAKQPAACRSASPSAARGSISPLPVAPARPRSLSPPPRRSAACRGACPPETRSAPRTRRIVGMLGSDSRATDGILALVPSRGEADSFRGDPHKRGDPHFLATHSEDCIGVLLRSATQWAGSPLPHGAHTGRISLWRSPSVGSPPPPQSPATRHHAATAGASNVSGIAPRAPRPP